MTVSIVLVQYMPEAFAAIRTYQGYRYTIVTIANGAKSHTAEAELWWQKASEGTTAKWHYFRRHVAATGTEAAKRVESEFREWVDGQREAL